MTIENENKIETEVADIEVEVTESETQNDEVAEPSSDDELEKYTKSVSKRINKLNARNRAAEEKAAQLEEQLAQKDQQVQQYYNAAVTYQQNLLEKEEETVQIKEREATELYKKAHASGDADLISKADSLKNEVAIQKEKVRIAKQKQDEANAQYQQPQQQTYQQPQQESQVVQPTQEALEWKQNNSWFGENAEATQYAQYTHMNLVNEGYEPDSEEYYTELNDRVYKVYPDLQSDNAEQIEDRPAVQRVASASVGGRQKTQGKKNGVQFSKSEVARLRGLKPHGMSEDAWLKSVAKEKQRIQSREAK
jgi:chromosome segregation ATPase